MPIYEYQCLKCKKQFEAIQSIKEKPLKSCEFCDGQVQRLISQSSFALKGGGWYQDGYHKKPAATKEKPAAKSPKPKQSGKTSTKAASTPN